MHPCGTSKLPHAGATDYLGTKKLEKTTAEVAAIGAAIRIHAEDPAFVGTTRDDITAVLRKTGFAPTRQLEQPRRPLPSFGTA